MRKRLLLATVMVAALWLAWAHPAFHQTAEAADPAETAAPAQEDLTTKLMEPGPIEDIVLGDADAPNVIVEYASMTCPHCAHFHTKIFPEVKAKYVDTGKARFVFREFPLDGLAVRASMLARCAPQDRYYPTLTRFFEAQETWAIPGEDGMKALQTVAEDAGISKEAFDACMADKALFDKIVAIRTKANEEYGVTSTPSLFVNGRRLSGPTLENVETAIGSE